MKYALTLFIIILAITSYGQKIKTDAVDAFNGVRTIDTKPESVAKRAYLLINAMCSIKDADTTTSLGFFFSPKSTTSLTKDSKIIILFEDGDKVEGNNSGQYKIVAGGEITAAMIDLNDTHTDLYNKPISKIRISSTSRNDDYEIEDKKKGMVIGMLALIKKQLNPTSP